MTFDSLCKGRWLSKGHCNDGTVPDLYMITFHRVINVLIFGKTRSPTCNWVVSLDEKLISF